MTTTGSIWRVDIAIVGPGKVHMVRIDDADGVADLCALIAYLRERPLGVSSERATATDGRPRIASDDPNGSRIV